MIKKSLRLMLLGAFALMSSVFVACDKYDDDIQGLQQQIDALKATVASLQGEIDGGAVITDVTANSEGIVVTLSNGKSYTVKNGKDGADGKDGQDGKDGKDGENGKDGQNGADGKDGQNGKDGVDGKDGKDGSVITIGDNGNWFIDGVDTGKPSQGAKGDKGDKGDAGKDGQNGKDGINGTNGKDGVDGKDGQDGKDGKDGANGKDGKDGVDGKDANTVYYEPCVAEGEHFGHWMKVTVTPEGVKTTECTEESWLHEGVLQAVYNPLKGELTFTGVTDSEGNPAGNITVKTGVQLASLAIVKDVLSEDTFMPLVESYNLFLAGTSRNYSHKLDLNNDGTDEYYNYIASNKLDMTYRVNPSNFVIDGVRWSLINRSVVTRADNDNRTLLEILNNNVIKSGDVVKFTARMIADRKDLGKNGNDVFALEATLADGGKVVSDFAEFRAEDLKDFGIVNIVNVPTGKKYSHICGQDADYNCGVIDFRVASTGKVAASAKTTLESAKSCASFVYNESIDLDDVFALAEITKVKDLVADLGFDVTYKFEKVDEFVVAADNNTDQQKFVTFDSETNVVAVDKTWLAQGNAAIGRTPAFIAQAYIGETLMAEALVKLEIAASAPKAAITVEVEPKVLEYSEIIPVKDETTGELYNKVVDKKESTILQLDWEDVNEKIYAALGLSAQQFAAIYVDQDAPVEVFAQLSKTNKNANATTKVTDLDDSRDYIIYSNSLDANGNIVNSNGGYYDGVWQYSGNRGAMVYTQGISGKSTATNGAYVAFDPTSIWNYGQNTIEIVYRAADSHIYGDVRIKFTYTIKHENQFPALNPNYKLNETTAVKYDFDGDGVKETQNLATVQVTGKRDGGVWKLQNGIGEIFENYLVKKVGANYQIALPGNHHYIKFELIGKLDQYNTTSSKRSDVVAAGSEITLANGGNMLSATMTDKLRESVLASTTLTASETNGRIAIVKVTIYGENTLDPVAYTKHGYVCEQYVAVKFVSPFKVSMNEITLKTSKLNDYSVASLVDALVIRTNDQDNEVVFQNGKFVEGVSAEIRALFTPAMFEIVAGAALGENKDDQGKSLLFTDNINASNNSIYNTVVGYEKDANGVEDPNKPIYKYEMGEQIVVWRNTGSAFVNGTIASQSVVTLTVKDAANMKATGVINIVK